MAAAELSAISALVNIVRKTRDALRALRQEKLSTEHRETVEDALDQLSDAQDRIVELQAGSIELREENDKLKRQIADSDDWKERLAKYLLATTEGGAMVLIWQGEDEHDCHFACPACAEKDKQIQILQDLRAMSGNFRCPACGVKYPIKPSQSYERVSRPSGWMGIV